MVRAVTTALVLHAAVFLCGLIAGAEQESIHLTSVVAEAEWFTGGERCEFLLRTLDTNAVAKDYATLTIDTKKEKGSLLFRDTIVLKEAYGGTKFERVIKYPTNNFLKPQEVTIDISRGGKSVRQFAYANGVATFVDGKAKSELLNFDGGILTFNALLRVTPRLANMEYRKYVLPQYAEIFLFRIHIPIENKKPFVLTHEGTEIVKLGGRSIQAERFRMELPSETIQTDIWTSSNQTVKFKEWLGEAGSIEGVLRH